MGREILKLQKDIKAPGREEMDITDYDFVEKYMRECRPDIVLHLAAATNPPEHNARPELGLSVNIIGTANLSLACLKAGARLVYASSDYIYAGPGPHKEDEAIKPAGNFYMSKLGGECAVALCPNHLILRLSFGPAPFPWQNVYDNQLNSKLYADEMAPLVLAAAKTTQTGIMNLGGPQTSLLDYARRTRKDIKAIPTPDWVPRDTSLDIGRMKAALNISDESKLLKHL